MAANEHAGLLNHSCPKSEYSGKQAVPIAAGILEKG